MAYVKSDNEIKNVKSLLSYSFQSQINTRKLKGNIHPSVNF